MERYVVEVSREPRSEEVAHLERKLRESNDRVLGPDTPTPLAVLVRGPGGSIAGGLSGVLARGWLEVELLWVDPSLRGSGLGGEILERAEREARAQGCDGVLVETYDFQALPFYEARGYERFATLEGFPRGSRQHYLAKRFGNGPPPE